VERAQALRALRYTRRSIQPLKPIPTMTARPDPLFLQGGGDAAALMRSLDWEHSPLGHPSGWPAALATIVDLILHAKFPMFVAWGPQLGLVYNDAYAEVLGAKHPAAMGQPFRGAWGEIWVDIAPSIEQALQGQATYHENRPLTMHRKGYVEQTWFTFSYSPVRDAGGQVGGMYCACIETTAQVLAARHRSAELERLQQLFQQAPGVMAVLSEPGHVFELANDSYLQLVGQRDLIGKGVREALPELEGQGFFHLLDHVVNSGEPFVGRAIPVRLQREPGAPLDERHVDFVFQPIRDPGGKVGGVFVEGVDVTDSVRATAALRDSERRLQQLANTIPQMAWMADAGGYVHWYNDRWFEYTGVRPADVLGEGWSALVHPDDLGRLVERWRHALSTGERYEVQARLRSVTGVWRTFFISAAPLRDVAGRIVQWFGTNTDVTEIEEAQEELRQANRRKDEFLAMLAHELRNPMAPISTAAELLRLAPGDPARVRQTSEVISRQVEHMTRLVDDLLDVSRVTRGLIRLHPDLLDLNQVLRDALEQTAQLVADKKQALHCELAPEAVQVMGDRTRLIQVFANILNNASRYTQAGGEIRVILRREDERALVTVSDNGAGIAPALLPHIFDLFIQGERSPDRAQGGLGVGLALVRSLVQLHGGQVWAHSAGPGQGSTFEVSLPLQHSEVEGAKEAPAAAGPRPGQRAHILVVDDNEDAGNMLALLLGSLGYRTTVCLRAEEAIATAAREQPAVLFIDIGLPDMDGYALAQALRAQPAGALARLVAVTGYGQPEDRARALAAGFDEHLVKPVKLQALARILEHIPQGAPES
jgi:PAS domain S-box-containing protein